MHYTYNTIQTGNTEKKCYNCGGIFPHPNGRTCPAKGKQRNVCKKLNHFVIVCRQGKKSVFGEDLPLFQKMIHSVDEKERSTCHMNYPHPISSTPVIVVHTSQA